ncbi:MAG: MerR family transcriptional regulator [Bacteroidales bacterium]|nr:MerR family transcriptional regulator [Bacteroidales bacterium]
MGETATYSIIDLERLTGVKAHTIRIWEKRYGICAPGRNQGGIRHYGDEDLRHMLNISILRKKGYKISEIAAMCRHELGEKVMNEVRTGAGDQRVEEMILTMINLDEEGFREILQASMLEHGLELTFSRLIQPFFERIGIMWLAGTINPAQEHFVSNIIRQKLIVAINSLEAPQDPKALKFILFLPEGELHELGLLLYTYIIKKNGHRVVYLGQSTPLGCIRNVIGTQGGDVILTMITASITGERLNSYLRQLATEFPDRALLISGAQVWQDDVSIPEHPRLVRIAGVESLKEHISELSAA